MKKSLFMISIGTVGLAVAANLPDYPVIYDAANHRPVANPQWSEKTVRTQPTALSDAQNTTDGNATVPSSSCRSRLMNPACYEVDLNVSYGFKATPDNRYACDMVGFEVEGAFYFARHNALTLSVGVAGGGQTDDFWVKGEDGKYFPFTDSYDRTSFTLMGGYRFSCRPGERWLLQLGAKCGLDVQTLDLDYGYGWSDLDGCDDWGPNQDDTAVGMSYAAYMNLGYRVWNNTSVYLGYEFRGTTARPKANFDLPDMPLKKSGTMRWHAVRLGVNIRF